MTKKKTRTGASDWQQYIVDDAIAAEKKKDKRAYVLDMFPYPSAQGLHVGHPEGYTASDIYSRFLRMNGFSVLHPMGFDAFGLPAENYAIKTGTQPEVTTKKNIENMRRQIKSLGFSYDWSREVVTSDPAYYKWTQWIFLKLFEAGLAYETFAPINWCPKDKTGLANEEVINGKCERCGTAVEKKNIKQWLVKITDKRYIDRLEKDLDPLDWPESIKLLQKNWIGKSEGAHITFSLRGIFVQDDDKHAVEVFTTRPDTIYGATFLVISPELAKSWLNVGWKAVREVQAYIKKSLQKSDVDRQNEGKEKTGVDSGIRAVNPVTKKEIPVWIADYVLGGYGTGAIMAVPAHDERDFAFAKKYKLGVVKVVEPPKVKKPFMAEKFASAGSDGRLASDLTSECWTGEGMAINSGPYDGLSSQEFQKKIIAYLEKEKKGKAAVNYKMRDWVFSRQRYWGEPIPIVHCEKCGNVAVPEKDLPLELPKVKKYEPTGTGESPLAAIEKWVNTKCPNCGGKAKRETNTMPQWAGSNWYFLRYTDPHNTKQLADPEKIKLWMPVDVYVGGAEHAVLHLLYARFIYKFLYDSGVIPKECGDEPFKKLKNQGIILGEDGQKMSKSRGNVVNPDEIIEKFGADTMRMYEMFMGPFEDAKPWSTQGLVGVRRFLDRIGEASNRITDSWKESAYQQYVNSITKGIQHFRLNTCISDFMKWSNGWGQKIEKKEFENFLKVLAPFAPYITEELWHSLGHTKSIHMEPWPNVLGKTEASTFTLVVMVNGKKRDDFSVPTTVTEQDVKAMVHERPKVKTWISGKKIQREMYVKGKVYTLVVKD